MDMGPEQPGINTPRRATDLSETLCLRRSTGRNQDQQVANDVYERNSDRSEYQLYERTEKIRKLNAQLGLRGIYCFEPSSDISRKALFITASGVIDPSWDSYKTELLMSI